LQIAFITIFESTTPIAILSEWSFQFPFFFIASIDILIKGCPHCHGRMVWPTSSLPTPSQLKLKNLGIAPSLLTFPHFQSLICVVHFLDHYFVYTMLIKSQRSYQVVISGLSSQSKVSYEIVIFT
jgi:hypothetical protein